MRSLALLLCSTILVAADTITTNLNPGCDTCTEEDKLVYAQSTTDAAESYHYFWSSLVSAVECIPSRRL